MYELEWENRCDCDKAAQLNNFSFLSCKTQAVTHIPLPNQNLAITITTLPYPPLTHHPSQSSIISSPLHRFVPPHHRLKLSIQIAALPLPRYIFIPDCAKRRGIPDDGVQGGHIPFTSVFQDCDR